MTSYAYLSLNLTNETYTTSTGTNGNIIPFTNYVTSDDISVTEMPVDQIISVLYGYITVTTPGYYMISYMIQPNPSPSNFSILPIVGYNKSSPSAGEGNEGVDFSLYQSEQSEYQLINASSQVSGNTIYYLDIDQTLSLYQAYPSTGISFSNNGTISAYLLVYLLPSNNSWCCFNNLSTNNPSTIYQGYNSIGSGVPVINTVPFNNVITSTLSGENDFNYNNGEITYTNESCNFLIMFMVNLMGYGNANYGLNNGTYNTYIIYENYNFPVYSYNFGFSINSVTSEQFISGVINPSAITVQSGSSDVGDTFLYPTYQTIQLIGSELTQISTNQSISLNCTYFGDSTVLQNQMYGTLQGINARIFMFPITDNYMYLTNNIPATINNGTKFSYTTFTNNNDTFTYDNSAYEITILQTSNIIVYFSVTVQMFLTNYNDQNTVAPLITLKVGEKSEIFSNSYYQYNNNTYSVIGMSIFQNVPTNSAVYIANSSNNLLQLAYDPKCINCVFFVMKI